MSDDLYFIYRGAAEFTHERRVMKKILIGFLIICLVIPTGCAKTSTAEIAATTLPVAEFTSRLCQGTGLTVTRLVTAPVSCLHNYSLNIRQVKAAESAEIIVINGGGLEDFLDGIISSRRTIDASSGLQLLESDEHSEKQEHQHEGDPHIWLSPAYAEKMAENICSGLSTAYPEYAVVFRKNLEQLQRDLASLQQYGEDTLCELSCRKLITFHDGFSYFAMAFDLEILEAVEEESGSEASAQELIHLIRLTEQNRLPAIFTETNGSTSAASVIHAETGAAIYTLDMAMAGDSYFAAMYRNIQTIQEALK